MEVHCRGWWEGLRIGLYTVVIQEGGVRGAGGSMDVASGGARGASATLPILSTWSFPKSSLKILCIHVLGRRG